MNRYVIIGAGAIGGTLAAAGCDAGLSITVIARGEHADAIAAGGLAMRTPSGTITARPELARSPEEVELRTGDVLVLATKTNQALTALPQWADRPVTGASGTVIGTAGELLPIVLLLNGTEAARQAPRHFRTVVAATVWMPALFLSPARSSRACSLITARTSPGRSQPIPRRWPPPGSSSPMRARLGSPPRRSAVPMSCGRTSGASC